MASVETANVGMFHHKKCVKERETELGDDLQLLVSQGDG
jgi:hypothetical protein